MLDEMLKQFENQHGFFALTPGDLREFAEKVAAAEREACAKVCEELIEHTKKLGNNDAMLTAISCAVAIRARGER